MKSWKECRQTVSIPLRQVSILCLAAITSAAIVSSHMSEAREKSREPEAYRGRNQRHWWQTVLTEVMLLGQNVNSYGKTLEHPVTFAQLLKQVEAIEGLERIRFMTSHPKDLSDELIETMAESKKICHHLHLPMQSGSSRDFKDHEPPL